MWRVALAVCLTAGLVSQAPAHKVQKNAMELTHPWVRAVPKGAPVAPAYVKIVNAGEADDRLTGASLRGAESAELHKGDSEGSAPRSERIENGIAIPSGGTVTLERGGPHIRFLGIKTTLDEDSYVDGSLTFEKAGRIDIEFFVEPAPEAAGSEGESGTGEP